MAKWVKKLVFYCPDYRHLGLNFGLLALRVYAGVAIAFEHGFSKIPPPPGFVTSLQEIGFMFSGLWAWGTGIIELVCGVLLAVGLAVRASSFLLANSMFLVAFVFHRDEPFANFESALLYGMIAILYIFSGPGKFSIDRNIYRKKRSKVKIKLLDE
ncbi:DoxX family protein [Bacteroidota bacterium]